MLRPHVAQLIETMAMGGAERLAVQIANARAEAGDVSHLYVLTAAGVLSERIAPGVRVRYLGLERAPIGRPLAFGASLLRGYRTLARQVERDGIRVMQTHLPAGNFWGLLLAWRRRCAVVATIHNNEEFRYGQQAQALRYRLRRRAYRGLLDRAAAVVAVSEEVKQSLLEELRVPEDDRLRRARVAVVPNGVEIPAPLPQEMLAQARARHGILPDEPLVLGAGRLTEQKNFAALIDAAALLRASGVRCRFLIAGDGPQRAYLTRRAADLGLDGQVLLPGTVTDLQELMQGADVFALPSLWEGLPLVLLEAMACGLPVAGSRIRGVAEVVEDGVSGLLCEPGDVPCLAAALRSLLGDARLRASCGAAGLEIVKRHYDFARVARELGEIYRRAAAGE